MSKPMIKFGQGDLLMAAEIMNDLRRTGEVVCKAFKDHGDHYEYAGSMNDVEDLRDAVKKARDLWMDCMVRRRADMDSPTFADRDAALRQMMGPPTAQEHLRESMRRDTDVRWDLMPVESPKPDRNIKWMLSALGIGVVVCGVMFLR